MNKKWVRNPSRLIGINNGNNPYHTGNNPAGYQLVKLTERQSSRLLLSAVTCLILLLGVGLHSRKCDLM